MTETDAQLERSIAACLAFEGRLLHCIDPAAEHAFRRDVQLRAADLAPFLERARQTRLATLGR